jgi:hypothetical protein
MRKIILILTLLLSFVSTSLYAQEGGGEEGDIFEESMTDIYIVVGMGTAGAILGLSTLSFVDEPSEHLNNIVVGGAIGIIIGVGIVAWRQASKSQNLYNETQEGGAFSTPHFSTKQRTAWHLKNDYQYRSSLAKTAVNYQFSF